MHVVLVVAIITALPAMVVYHEAMHCAPVWLVGDDCDIHLFDGIPYASTRSENADLMPHGPHGTLYYTEFLFIAYWVGIPLTHAIVTRRKRRA